MDIEHEPGGHGFVETRRAGSCLDLGVMGLAKDAILGCISRGSSPNIISVVGSLPNESSMGDELDPTSTAPLSPS